MTAVSVLFRVVWLAPIIDDVADDQQLMVWSRESLRSSGAGPQVEVRYISFYSVDRVIAIAPDDLGQERFRAGLVVLEFLSGKS